jgi:hypothetical protein
MVRLSPRAFGRYRSSISGSCERKDACALRAHPRSSRRRAIATHAGKTERQSTRLNLWNNLFHGSHAVALGVQRALFGYRILHFCSSRRQLLSDTDIHLEVLEYRLTAFPQECEASRKVCYAGCYRCSRERTNPFEIRLLSASCGQWQYTHRERFLEFGARSDQLRSLRRGCPDSVAGWINFGCARGQIVCLYNHRENICALVVAGYFPALQTAR